jgi:hypothetical protein
VAHHQHRTAARSNERTNLHHRTAVANLKVAVCEDAILGARELARRHALRNLSLEAFGLRLIRCKQDHNVKERLVALQHLAKHATPLLLADAETRDVIFCETVALHCVGKRLWERRAAREEREEGES